MTIQKLVLLLDRTRKYDIVSRDERFNSTVTGNHVVIRERTTGKVFRVGLTELPETFIP